MSDSSAEAPDDPKTATRAGAGPRPAPRPSNLPAAIGAYRILGLLGEGGMGIVYEAEQPSLRGTGQGFCYNAGRLAAAGAPFAIGFAADAVGLGAALGMNALFFALAGALVWLLLETRGVTLE